jgi:hypothetical protein
MRLAGFALVLAVLLGPALAPSSSTRAAEPAPPAAAPERAPRCEHGVKATICTRCNPKLAPVFKAKGDWCPEHDRPESQCVLCNRRLAKEGVK